MTLQYKRGNRYSARISIADAAVDWQNLDSELLAKVELNSRGMPVLQGCDDLLERAEGIHIAASTGLISGFVKNEDGDSLPPRHMQLDRASVASWISGIDKGLDLEQAKKATQGTSSGERLLKLSDVLEQIKVSESTLDRRIAKGLFAEPTYTGPRMWPESAVTEYLAKMVIKKVSKVPKGDI
jgi:predicted DNA-binding transcriptional regulator AlpA